MDMNCLECPNYWRDNIDETLCEECGRHKKEAKEEAENEQVFRF